MADSTTYEIDVEVRAPEAQSAAERVANLTNKLLAATEATAAAAAAVKAGETAYRQAQSSADRAAKSVEKLTLAADEQKNAMAAALLANDPKAYERASDKAAQLAQRLSEASAKSAAATNAMNEQAASLDRLRASAADAAAAEAALQQQTVAAGAAAKAAAKAADAEAKAQADAAEKAAKAQAEAVEKVAKAQKSQAEAAALAASGNGKVNEMAEALGRLGGPLGAAGQKVLQLRDGFGKLTNSLGSSTGVWVGATVAVAALVVGLISMASAAANAAIGLFKFAVGQERIDALSKRLDDNLKGLFSGLKLEGLLAGLDKLADLFNKDTESGRAIKAVLESIFQPAIDGVVELIPKVERFFLQFEIWTLKALIAIKPFGSIFVTIAEVIGVTIAVVVGAFAVAAAAATALFALVALPFVALVTAAVVAYNFFKDLDFATLGGNLINGLVNGITGAAGFVVDAVKNLANGAIDWLKNLSLADIGANLIQGLIKGISGGAGGVVSSIKGVAGGAIDAATKAFDQHSPSKIFERIGVRNGEGLILGHEQSTEDVEQSMTNMAALPDVSAPITSTAGASSLSASGGITIEAGAIVINAPGGDAPSIGAAVREALLEVFEGNAAQLGQAVPA